MNLILIILLVLIVLAILVVLALACIAVVLIAIRLLTKKEKKPEQLQLPLPGTNCGQCGLPSCQDFVNQVSVNPGYVRNCPYLAPEIKQQVENKIVRQ